MVAMTENQIRLTKEQKRCVEYSINEKILLIDADPGTGKTEILRHRVRFIHHLNAVRKKLILVLAVGKSIVRSIKTKLKKDGLKEIYDRLETTFSEFSPEPLCEGDCYCCIDKKKPLILVCTVHSIAYWIIMRSSQLWEGKKIKILTSGSSSRDFSFLYQNSAPQVKEMVSWARPSITADRKRKIFAFLLKEGKIWEKVSPEEIKELRKIFLRATQINHQSSPYYHWVISDYSEFLVQAKEFFLPLDKIEVYQELARACGHDQEKNVWMSFEDMIENAPFCLEEVNRVNFDYILVDECQDLKSNLLFLITQIFSHKLTNFTFVGDPKQNIMAFAGATEDVFKSLRERFPDYTQLEITSSFRVPQEVATLANDFTSKFMPYRPKLTTNLSSGGKRPVVFIAETEQNHQLISPEENKINYKNNRELEKQIDFIISVVSKLDKSSSRAILYRNNEIGARIVNWLVATNSYHDFLLVNDPLSAKIRRIVNIIKTNLKNKPSLVQQFSSLGEFLSSLRIKWQNIFPFPQMVTRFEQERILDPESENRNLSEEDISSFILQVDKLTIKEKNTEEAGKTRLLTIHKAKGLEFDYVFLIAADEGIIPKSNRYPWEEVNLFYTAITRTKKELYLTASCPATCSRFIKNLNPALIELEAASLNMLPATDKSDSFSFPAYHSLAELFGEKGEEEVLQLLTNNRKIKWEKIKSKWAEVDGLEIDIYAETAKKIYLIEVKNWSESFYYSPDEKQQKKEILEQQFHRQEKIFNEFFSAKPITYLISFPSGELANDFQNFLREEKISELRVTHHDKINTEAWKADYGILRIDKLIESEAKTERKRNLNRQEKH
jgi:superfamily I DNA/RNA helicase